MSIWVDIRTRHRAGEGIKEISRATGISKNTVKKYLRTDVPPGKTKQSQRQASMARFQSEIDVLLRESPTIRSPRVVRIIQERLDASFRISERSAREYVALRRARISSKEVFVRLVYAPGDQMQFDFKDISANVGGVQMDLHMFVARLNYSTHWFARCYRTEDRSALFDGILAACKSFGGVPREGVFDNASTAVNRILRGRDRVVNTEFAEFCGSLMLAVQFAAPAKGNEKGGVEGLHGYIEDNVFVPMLCGATLDSINAMLSTFCLDDMNRRLVAGEFVHKRFERESKALRPLPNILPSACIREYARVNKFSEVTYKTNRYSVPTEHAHGNAYVECYANHVKVVVGDEVVAEHPRCFAKHQSILDPLHFIDLLERKHRAVEYAAVFADERFSGVLQQLLRRYVETDRVNAGKNFVSVIKLLQTHALDNIVAAVQTAELHGTSDPNAIVLILTQQSFKKQSSNPLSLDPQILGVKRPSADLSGYTFEALGECA